MGIQFIGPVAREEREEIRNLQCLTLKAEGEIGGSLVFGDQVLDTSQASECRMVAVGRMLAEDLVRLLPGMATCQGRNGVSHDCRDRGRQRDKN